MMEVGDRIQEEKRQAAALLKGPNSLMHVYIRFSRAARIAYGNRLDFEYAVIADGCAFPESPTYSGFEMR